MMRILLVEDDPSLLAGLSFKLQKEGYTVLEANSAGKALALLETASFDMAILDIGLPDGDGFSLCRELRRHSAAVHILFLTARDTETDIVMGYDTGADDYLTKPFSVSVLLGKINAVARRSLELPSVAGISLDTARQTATVRGVPVVLTRNEQKLLHTLLRNAGKIVSKEQLLAELWDIDGDFVDENTLAVNIRRLREKVERDPSHPELIETVRGVGYRLSATS